MLSVLLQYEMKFSAFRFQIYEFLITEFIYIKIVIQIPRIHFNTVSRLSIKIESIYLWAKRDNKKATRSEKMLSKLKTNYFVN